MDTQAIFYAHSKKSDLSNKLSYERTYEHYEPKNHVNNLVFYTDFTEPLFCAFGRKSEKRKKNSFSHLTNELTDN